MRRLTALAAAGMVLEGGAFAYAQTAPKTPPKTASSDPFAWLEDIHGDRALAWVKGQNSLGKLVRARVNHDLLQMLNRLIGFGA
jgi:hypothetical protein